MFSSFFPGLKFTHKSEFIIIFIRLRWNINLILRVRVVDIIRFSLTLLTHIFNHSFWFSDRIIYFHGNNLFFILLSLSLSTFTLNFFVISMMIRVNLLLKPLPDFSWYHLSVGKCSNDVPIGMEITTRLWTIFSLNILKTFNPVVF